MNSKKIVCVLSVVAASLLSACANFGQQVPLDNPTAYSLPDGKTADVRSAWWRQLKDPKLNRYIEQALEKAPALQAARSRMEQAQAQIGLVGAANKTQVSLNATGFGMLSSSKPDMPYSPEAQPNHVLTLANTSLQVGWSFDFWGKNRAQIASVIGQQNAIRYEAEQTRLMLAHAVAAQYFAWQGLKAQQDVLKQRIDNASAHEKLLQQRVKAQLLAPSAVYAAQQARQQLEGQILALEREAARVRHALAVLTGQPANALDKDSPSSMAGVPAVRSGNLKADLLARRPDIAAQRELLNSKTQAIQSTRAEFYPNIELKLLAGLSRIDAFNLINNQSGMLGVLPAVHLPIFTSGALQSKLAGRHAEYNQQVAQYNQTVLDAMRTAADAVSDYQISRQQLTQQQAVLATARKSVAAIQRRVGAGLENKTAYLQKNDELLQQQAALSIQQSTALLAWSHLQAQLGGGFLADEAEKIE